MADFEKIGLLILNPDRTRFLVCEKYNTKAALTTDFIMPGGCFDEETVEECLRNEIKEELNCTVDFSTLKYINRYAAPASGAPDKIVAIELYAARIIGTPTPSTEIHKVHWIGREDVSNPQVSPIIREKIIPDLVLRSLLI